MEKFIKSEEFGGKAGEGRDIVFEDLESLIVRCSDGDDGIIYALSFTCVANDESLHAFGPWGGTGGCDRLVKLTHRDDHVTEIRGTTTQVRGVGKVIQSLWFSATVSGRHGPFGGTGGDSFTIKVPDAHVVAFYGHTNGQYLTGLGAYLVKQAN